MLSKENLELVRLWLKHGDQQAIATKLEVSKTYVSEVLSQRQPTKRQGNKKAAIERMAVGLARLNKAEAQCVDIEQDGA